MCVHEAILCWQKNMIYSKKKKKKQKRIREEEINNIISFIAEIKLHSSGNAAKLKTGGIGCEKHTIRTVEI